MFWTLRLLRLGLGWLQSWLPGRWSSQRNVAVVFATCASPCYVECVPSKNLRDKYSHSVPECGFEGLK